VGKEVFSLNNNCSRLYFNVVNDQELRSTYICTASTHSHKNGHLQQQQQEHYHKVRWEDIQKLAAAKFSDTHEGITYLDLCTGSNKLVYTPKHARFTLRYYKRKGQLFTSNRRNPQQYFLSKEESEFSLFKCTHFDTTGVQARKQGAEQAFGHAHAPITTTATVIADTFLESLAIAKTTPLYIHNLAFHVQLYHPRIDDNPYDRITNNYCTLRENKTKEYEYRRGKTHVKFKAYPNNTVDIHISCSNNPFPLETQEDVTTLFCFVGGVHETLRVWLSDISNTITPPLHDWKFIRADLNKDVPASPKLFFSMPKMQLRTAEDVFRIYAKPLPINETSSFSKNYLYIRQEKMLSKDAVPAFTKDAIYDLMKNTDTDPYTAINNDNSNNNNSWGPEAQKEAK
jgi:hypothetical protein